MNAYCLVGGIAMLLIGTLIGAASVAVLVMLE